MRRCSLVLWTALLLGQLPAALAEEPTLEALKATHESEVQKIQAAHAESRKKPLEAYAAALPGAVEALKKAGDPDPVLQAVAEKQRFEVERTIPFQPDAKLPKTIQNLQSACSEALQAAEVEKNRRVVALTQKYVAVLDGLMKSLTTQEKLDMALNVKAEKERAASIMAQAESRQPKPSSVVDDRTPVSKHPTVGRAWQNSLGMKFVPVPGTPVLFCIWETRVQDFRAFAEDKANNGGYDYRSGREPHVLKADGWKQRGWEYGWNNPGFRQGVTHPVTCVSWEDAKKFCDWLTRRERQAGLLSLKQSYRVPQDWEWSVAVGLNETYDGTPRSKTEKIADVYPWGTQWPPPRGAGNYAGTEARSSDWPSSAATMPGYRDGFARTAPVGSFDANRLGLFDLGGNVWEWCADCYDEQSAERVVRGGSWHHSDARNLLSSLRGSNTPDDRSGDRGFRCVLVVSTP